jgi:hypothetical protein
MTRRRKLSEAEWRDVFKLRCKSKTWGTLTGAERALVDAAYREDETRYGDMEIDVFNATVPFGSGTRRKRD